MAGRAAISRTPGIGVGLAPPRFRQIAPWLRGISAMEPVRMSKTPSAPIVERVAGWSARHRLIAVFGWLLLVVAALMIGRQLGTDNINSYDPGQAGQAERVLSRPVVQQPDSESVLVQGRSPR